MGFGCKKIFVGGYTKSGTTFIGRAFGILNGVYAKGEEDYFRLLFEDVNKMARKFNHNINIVNAEVYDGQGSIAPVSRTSLKDLHQSIFYHIFFNGQPMPKDCVATVEKSPHNIFHLDAIRFVFPNAVNICVYRKADRVFRSLMRHMADHRDAAYHDPASEKRRSMLAGFCKKWPQYAALIEKERQNLTLISYDAVADDTAGFLDFAQTRVIGRKLGLKAPIETLSKDYYLKSLPPEAREKSLVQTGSYKITLSDEEEDMIARSCPDPQAGFDF